MVTLPDGVDTAPYTLGTMWAAGGEDGDGPRVVLRARVVSLDSVLTTFEYSIVPGGGARHDQDHGYLQEVAVTTLPYGNWAFDGAGWRVVRVVGQKLVGRGTTPVTLRSVLNPHEYTVGRILEYGDEYHVAVRDLDLRRWEDCVPDIYVHLEGDGTADARVPGPVTPPLSTNVYGAVTRALDLRTDKQVHRDILQRVEDNRACRLYPSCECAVHGRVKECVDRFGVLFDDG